ncbi:CRISPR-associated protein Csm4 [Caldanaerovirga acetigignens]|uniref:CRISPR system Cms protein Csm4 n=1 Tax=Caldanaerovirga acetigignens TaxID=447595 RepID=A0A1M7M6Q4_9FIRM|nr:type III-A CRISPR-associated RAMP protein Csm4 [Caldanaerovirga acetigignens]SHM86398.1 CRISPR-associated protein Csm4 [Caldanaerovirga acetigignens]
MKKYRVKLKFKGPVHFGYKEKMDNLTEYVVHSDTIFSGIMSCYNLLYGKDKADKLADNFVNGVYLFENSSAFIYVGEDYLLPRPINLDLYDLVGDYKKAKKVKYISEDILGDKCRSGVCKGQFLLKGDYKGDVVRILERPRVVLDRLSNSSNIYYISSCVFDENAGLWFYLKVDPSVEREILAAIRLLGDEGLGGERTYGLGCFEPTFVEAKDDEKSSDEYLLLSLYSPSQEDDLRDSLFGYDFIERGGYVYSIYSSDIKKRRIRMLVEGSVFRKKLRGTVIDVTPEGFEGHRVLRYGVAFLKPL